MNRLFGTRYAVKLDVFEGPMDLLVHLVIKNDMDILDIPIAIITEQYMAYLEMLQSLDIEFAGDFLLMASTLTHIKSRMLLPPSGGEEDEDPRMEIARPLLEYLRMKRASEWLGDREMLGTATFVRQEREPAPEAPAGEDRPMEADLMDLVNAFRELMAGRYRDHAVDFSTEKLSVRQRIEEVAQRLARKGSILFTDLFHPKESKAELVVTFLAILEMAKQGRLRIMQHVQSGIIRIFAPMPGSPAHEETALHAPAHP
ncbi:segregation and condensation protein A [Desulfoluna spongiiphila]|uniref:Segregation and condensation protein A n=1 Tax=Desulfoluna spongiiphila TaxID=419481 RepID=A0A1G5ELD5_9BACT|nr:segregation/condensation protein A [Desulfoluna spongiiphila]SCY27762.1 condensin subunit ScpA [Desulfoluna spongiiphila]VVS91198.1 segregation and condensation protein a [Desulfoluna spongiiphila]